VSSLRFPHESLRNINPDRKKFGPEGTALGKSGKAMMADSAQEVFIWSPAWKWWN
jgi:hypothetical protein